MLAFDLLELNGTEVRKQPLVERKELLAISQTASSTATSRSEKTWRMKARGRPAGSKSGTQKARR
jgi:ATP-dependent DNA ligase